MSFLHKLTEVFQPADESNRFKYLIAPFITLIVFFVVLFNLRSIFAQSPVNLFFFPSVANLPPDSVVDVMLNANTENISFVRVELDFDSTLINLSGEISTSSAFGNVIEKTSMTEANSTGHIVLVLALNVGETPPTGTFQLAQIPVTAVSTDPNLQTNLSFSTGSQIVNSDAGSLGIESENAVFTLNSQAPTSTPSPTLTPTPTDLPSPTPTDVPTPEGANLYLTEEQTGAFLGESKSLDINFDTDIEVSGVDAVILYDPAKLEVQTATGVALLSDTTLTDIDNLNGVLRISQTAPAQQGFIGSGIMATINVVPLAPGSQTLTFDFVQGAKNESNAIAINDGADVLNPPNPLILDVVERVFVAVNVQTPSDNSQTGHAVDGTLTEPTTELSQQFSTDPLGQSAEYEVETSLAGSVADFYVKVSGFLKEKVNRFISGGSNLLNFGLLRAGDLNDDGVVNNIDLSLMYDDWFASGVTADYNKDGIVNSFDHYLLTKNFFLQDE